MLFTSIDFQKPGKQQGFMQVPYSHNLSGWANVMIPITTVANGIGPTVLILGGNHGDEYQGQIAAMKIARELTPDMVTGRIILIPSLNFPAARAATRLSPLDGMNMNRAFPGDPEGSATSQIAHFLTNVLFPLSDVVIDIHSGLKSASSLMNMCRRATWSVTSTIWNVPIVNRKRLSRRAAVISSRCEPRVSPSRAIAWP